LRVRQCSGFVYVSANPFLPSHRIGKCSTSPRYCPQALPDLRSWGVSVDDPEAAFREIDQDGGGMVLFDEFADWALRKALDLEV